MFVYNSDATLKAAAVDFVTRIEKIVAVCEEGVVPPCGRCRELMYQVDFANAETDVIVSENKVMRLKDLLPVYWQ